MTPQMSKPDTALSAQVTQPETAQNLAKDTFPETFTKKWKQMDQLSVPEVPNPTGSPHSGKKGSILMANYSGVESMHCDKKKFVRGFHSDQPNTITVQKPVLLVN